MSASRSRPLVVLASALCLPSLGVAQSRFATTVVSFQQGSGSGIFVPANILGGPQGGGFSNGSLHVLTLGNAGVVTLGFDVVLTNGPGADFTVSENGFEFGGGVFAEVCSVEVSTNGVDFARFPTRYGGPPGPHGDFDALAYATFAGLSGGAVVLSNVATNSIDPFDPVVSGGEAFDLAELAEHPLVQAGLVDLAQIHFVRLVDLVAGQELDSRGATIWDSGGASSADVDAVSVIQHTQNQAAGTPSVDFSFDVAGHLHLVIADADGLADVFSHGTVAASVNLQPVSFGRLRQLFRVRSATANELHLVSRFSLHAAPPQLLLAVSATDSAGLFSADQASVQP